MTDHSSDLLAFQAKPASFRKMDPNMAVLNNLLLNRSIFLDTQLAQQEFRVRLSKKETLHRKKLKNPLQLHLHLIYNDTLPCVLTLETSLIKSCLQLDYTDFELKQLDAASLQATLQFIEQLLLDWANRQGMHIVIKSIELKEGYAELVADHAIELDFHISSIEHFSIARLFLQSGQHQVLQDWIQSQPTKHSIDQIRLPLAVTLYRKGCDIEPQQLENLAIGDVILMDGDPTPEQWGMRIDQEQVFLLDAQGNGGVEQFGEHPHPDYFSLSLQSDTFLTYQDQPEDLIEQYQFLRYYHAKERIICVNHKAFARGREVVIGDRWGICIETFM